jgi:putative ABC transport system permease protein
MRDLWAMKSQIAAIGLVLGAGIAMVVGYWGTFDSLGAARASYYADYRFADVFARATRVPSRVEQSIAAIPGVAAVATRVVMDVPLDLPGVDDPATARLISTAAPRRPSLNDVRLVRGRWIEPGRPDEALVSTAFADRNRVEPGSRVAAVINGRRRPIEIVGIVASPEYIYSIRPGEMMPDDSRFGIFWMEHRALAAAFDMEGGFNDVAVALSAPTATPEVLTRLDGILRPYGGTGAVPRAQQLSNWFLDNELEQLRTAGTAIPVVFFAVAVFLVNLVLARIVSIQRSQIAALKALGYSRHQIGRHYLGWGLFVAAIGAVVGVGFGDWLGHAMVGLYKQYFQLPTLRFALQPPTAALAIGAGLLAGITGSIGAVWRAVRMPPAEAMKPAAPARYRRTFLEQLGLARRLTTPMLMVARNLSRRPVRALLSIFGIGMAAAMMVVGMFSLDAIDVLRTMQFDLAERQDATVTFLQARQSSVRHELARLPGVWSVEPFRAVPVRVGFGHRSHRGAVLGLEATPRLNRIIDSRGRPVDLRGDGLVVSRAVADRLGFGAGDVVQVEILEGRRGTRAVPIDALVDDFLGTRLYMKSTALRPLLEEGLTFSGAFLQIDRSAGPALFRRLKQIPGVAGVTRTEAARDSFNATIDKSLRISIAFNVLFSSIIAIGVVYNAARVALSERSRDLASLRVLGFTRREISLILLGELATLTLAAIPVGLALGYGLAALLVQALSTELFRFPLAVSSQTFTWSGITVAVSAAGSGLIVRRRLDDLDLVGVLKAAE